MKNTLKVNAQGWSKFSIAFNGENYHVRHDAKEYYYTNRGIMILFPPKGLIEVIEAKVKQRRTLRPVFSFSVKI